MPTDHAPPALAALLPADLALGAPDRAGALTVFPLLGRPGEIDFRSFAEASAHGCVVQELVPPSVGDLLVVNPLDVPVLLYEGEEVRGARQDRTVDATVLVPAHARLPVAVSCVEAGRWDGARHDEAFTPSADSAFPSLRAAKHRRRREAVAAEEEGRAQQEVWTEIAAAAERFESPSETGAMGDIFRARAARIAELAAGITRRDGQLGALACVGDRPLVLDFVSRPDVFAALWQPLLRGYCLDALAGEPDGGGLPGPVDGGAPAGSRPGAVGDSTNGDPDGGAVSGAVGGGSAGDRDGEAGPDPAAWLDAIRSARPRVRTAPGLGAAVTFGGATAAGAGLAVGRELVQLSAFPVDARGAAAARRILRPSRRR